MQKQQQDVRSRNRRTSRLYCRQKAPLATVIYKKFHIHSLTVGRTHQNGGSKQRLPRENIFMEEAIREQIVTELKRAYGMELETVQNYLANSIDLDGVRAEEIKKSLAADIQEELTHAMTLAKRIKVLGGRVPGSLELEPDQRFLQPPADSTDLISVIKGVIAAEDSAIAQYEKIIALCDQKDFVTQDTAIGLLGDEQEHRRAFIGFLTEFEKR